VPTTSYGRPATVTRRLSYVPGWRKFPRISPWPSPRRAVTKTATLGTYGVGSREGRMVAAEWSATSKPGRPAAGHSIAVPRGHRPVGGLPHLAVRRRLPDATSPPRRRRAQRVRRLSHFRALPPRPCGGPVTVLLSPGPYPDIGAGSEQLTSSVDLLAERRGRSRSSADWLSRFAPASRQSVPVKSLLLYLLS